MFIEKIPILVGLATPLGLTMASSLVSLDLQKPSRAAAVVVRGILYFLGVLASRNFKTPLIMSDGGSYRQDTIRTQLSWNRG
jgi:phosphatidylserine synthase